MEAEQRIMEEASAAPEDEWHMRREAVAAIFDQEILFKIALTDTETDICREATLKIFEKSYLIEISKSVPSMDVREAAAEQLQLLSMLEHDQRMLKRKRFRVIK
ncbi:hypothetical protein ACFL43_04940 [Thermodesulfobacteriota bacterium]